MSKKSFKRPYNDIYSDIWIFYIGISEGLRASTIMAGVHLRSESEINVDGIFKKRVHLRELYHSGESLKSKFNENSQMCVHYT